MGICFILAIEDFLQRGKSDQCHGDLAY